LLGDVKALQGEVKVLTHLCHGLSQVSWNLRWRSLARRLWCGSCWASANDDPNRAGATVTKQYRRENAVADHGLELAGARD
jgi:succinate dehydrogenase/fumarate reductase-like Fe-S protein